MDPDAEMVLLKNLTFAGKEMKAGDLVTDEMQAKLGPYKLRNWWEAKIIEVRRAVPSKPQVMAAKPTAFKKKAKKAKKILPPADTKPEVEGDL